MGAWVIMFDHVEFAVGRIAESRRFFALVLQELGVEEFDGSVGRFGRSHGINLDTVGGDRRASSLRDFYATARKLDADLTQAGLPFLCRVWTWRRQWISFLSR